MTEQVFLGGRPVGLGQAELVAPVAAAPGQWALLLATSVASAATGWVLEEVASKVRRRKRRR